MSFSFEGYSLTPGHHDERFTDEVNIWWGRWDQREYFAAIIDSASTDSGNSDTTQLRTGLAMGIVTATGKWKPWNPYATDGTNYVAGFLLDEIDLTYMGSVKARLNAVAVKGNIKADFVVIAGEANRGISGTTYEFLLREQCAGRFLFDDDLGAYQVRREYTIAAATTAMTVTEAMNNTHFVTDTALGADCTLTLPVPRPGLVYHFTHPSTTAGTELILDGPGTGEFWAVGAAANTLTIVGDNTSGHRTLRCVRITDTTVDVFAYVLTGGVA